MADSTSRKSEATCHWLVLAWADGLRRVLESMVGSEALSGARFEPVAETGDWAGWPSPTWCQLGLPIAGAVAFVGCPQPAVEMLGRLIAGDSNLGESDCRETFLELINQAAGAGADAISERLGRRVQFSPAQTGDMPATGNFSVQIDITIQGSAHPLALVMNPELMSLVGEWAGAGTEFAAPPAGVPAPMQAPGAQASQPSGNLDLLMEVELPLCVTFGRTQLPLKDVLKLSSGSIVELNRLANEPVEVVINNCVIARGEVVVVDGNYGIRVTEIVSRQERIRSIL